MSQHRPPLDLVCDDLCAYRLAHAAPDAHLDRIVARALDARRTYRAGIALLRGSEETALAELGAAAARRGWGGRHDAA